jgi:PAS domain S-box-containing protein
MKKQDEESARVRSNLPTGQAGAFRDAVVITIIALLVLVIVQVANGVRAFAIWTTAEDHWGLIEALFILTLVVLGLAAFSLRRWKESKAELEDRKRAEQAQLESEKRYRKFFEDDITGDFISSPDGRILACNPAFVQIFGFDSIEQVLATNAASLHEGSSQREQFLSLLRKHRRLKNHHLIGLRHDGKRIHIVENVVGEFDAHGELVQIRGYVVDETERWLAEEALRASEARYRDLVDNAHDVIFTLSPAGNITSLNPAFEVLTGWERSEWQDKTFESILHPEDVSLGLKTFEQILGGEATSPFELRVRTKSGKLLIGEFIAALQFHEGRLAGVLGIARDITARKEAEVALQRSELWLGTVFEASRDGIVVEYNEGIVYANKAFASAYGYDDSKELIGQHVSIVQAPEDNERMLEFGRKRLRGESTPAIYEFKGKRKDGSVVDLEASVATSTIDGKRYIITMIRDIADRKRAEEERTRLIVELKDALANVKTLSGLLPICSSCKNIRDDKGYWHRVEAYVQNHSDANFTHGICPDCAKKLYPEYFGRIKPPDR